MGPALVSAATARAGCVLRSDRPPSPPRCRPLPCVPMAPAPDGRAEMGGRRRPKQGAGMARSAGWARRPQLEARVGPRPDPVSRGPDRGRFPGVLPAGGWCAGRRATPPAASERACSRPRQHPPQEGCAILGFQGPGPWRCASGARTCGTGPSLRPAQLRHIDDRVAVERLAWISLAGCAGRLGPWVSPPGLSAVLSGTWDGMQKAPPRREPPGSFRGPVPAG